MGLCGPQPNMEVLSGGHDRQALHKLHRSISNNLYLCCKQPVTERTSKSALSRAGGRGTAVNVPQRLQLGAAVCID